jgi:PAS domain S-box-containing protein
MVDGTTARSCSSPCPVSSPAATSTVILTSTDDTGRGAGLAPAEWSSVKRFSRLRVPPAHPGLGILLSLTLLVGVAIVDYRTGPEFGVSLFYLLPVVVAAWFGHRGSGYVIAVLAAGAWFLTDVDGRDYSTYWAPIWNSFTRLVYFTTAVVLVREYRAKRSLAESLAVSERKYRSVFENAAVGVARLSLDGQWLEVNDHLCESLGYSRDDLKSPTFTDIINQGDREDGAQQARRLARGEISRYETDVRFIRKDGSPVWVHVTGSSVRDGHGKLQYLVVLVEDISTRKQAEEALQRLNLELESRVLERTSELLNLNQELESFNYSIAHDLRAPLRGVDGFSHLLLEEYGDKLDEEGRQYLQRVRAGASRLGELIDALLALSQLSRGELRFARVNLTAIATEIAGALIAQDPNRRVEFEVAPRLLAVGDPGLLRTLLASLLENAWKFTSNTPNARITVGHGTEGGTSIFFVRDNGAGFDPTYSSKLFMPFQRLHAPGEFEGHGVGLATAQRIVKRHGGRLWAEGKVGEGATFSFTLANAGSSRDPRPSRGSEERASGRAPGTGEGGSVRAGRPVG